MSFRVKSWLLATAAAGCATAAWAEPQTVDAAGTAAPRTTATASTNDAPTGGLEEIVVTAERRAANIQDVPISVTALTAGALEAQGVRQINDLNASVPNLTATTGPQGSADANFFIRGIGQVDFIATNDPAVGIYVDGVYLGRTVGAMLDSSDIARVEVLRGPQGTLFGRNTLGGAVSITTEQPSLNGLAVRGRATYGSRDRIDVDGSINAPLGGGAAVRLGAFTRNQDGFACRDDGVCFGKTKRWGARGQLLLEPTERLSVTLSADYSLDKSNPAPSVLLAIAPLPFFPAGAAAQIQNPNNFYRVFASNSPESRNEIYGFSGTVAYDLGDAQLKSITAYRKLDAFSTSDPDGTAFPIYDQRSPTKQNQFSQEIQLTGTTGGFEYVLGGYYFRERVQQTLFLCFPILTFPPQPAGGTCNTWNQGNDQTTNSYAVFGQARFRFSDRFALLLGGRYTWEDKSIISNQAFDVRPNGLSPIAAGAFRLPIPPGTRTLIPIANNVPGELSFRRFTPKVGLEFKPSDDVLLFATFSRGFRSGGFNGRLIVPTTVVPTYAPDTADNYEIGVKSDLLDRTLRLNVTGFYTRYKDIQQTVADPAVQFRVANASRATLYGFEAEATAAPTDAIRFNLGVGYTHSEFSGVPIGVGPIQGNSLPFAPRWTVSTGAEYRFELADGARIVPRVDYRFQDRTFFTAFNLPFEQQAPYGLLSARLTFTAPNDRFSIAVYGENLTDEEYYTFGQNALGAQGVAYNYLGRPREFGVTAGIRF